MDDTRSTQRRADEHQQAEHGHDEGRMYARFGVMILTSTAVMFLLTYTNVFELAHVHWSEERLYMALLMGSAMAIVMLAFMWRMMYRNVRVNVGIIVAALVLGTTALWLSRSQALVEDEAYMKGMIPHHSIAILTSERATLEDLRVRELADGISRTQVEEIAEMEWLLEDIRTNGPAMTREAADQRPVPSFTGAAAGAAGN